MRQQLKSVSQSVWQLNTAVFTEVTYSARHSVSLKDRLFYGDKMALKLCKSALPQLLSWLRRYLPHSFKLKCRDFYSNKVPGVFGVTDEALTALLKDKSLRIDWSKPTEFIEVGNGNWSALKALSQEMGTSVQLIRGVLIKSTPQDIRPVPVPEGMKIQPVSEDYVRIVHSTWRFSGEHTEMFIRHLVEQHPSIVMTTDSGQYVGHMLGQSYGGIGMLYIQPEFRRKGYAKVIISQLAQKYLELGEDLYMVVETDNSASLNLGPFFNTKPVPNIQIAWVTFTPKEC